VSLPISVFVVNALLFLMYVIRPLFATAVGYYWCHWCHFYTYFANWKK